MTIRDSCMFTCSKTSSFVELEISCQIRIIDSSIKIIISMYDTSSVYSVSLYFLFYVSIKKKENGTEKRGTSKYILSYYALPTFSLLNLILNNISFLLRFILSASARFGITIQQLIITDGLTTSISSIGIIRRTLTLLIFFSTRVLLR